MAAKAEGPVSQSPSPPAASDAPPDAGGQDPADHRTAKETEEEEEEEEGREEPREAKRRRTCPAALEKFSPSAAEDGEESGWAGLGGFSFSFDTHGVPPIGTTPKFGSFNSSATADLGSGTAEEKEEERASDGNQQKAEGVNGKAPKEDGMCGSGSEKENE